MIKWMLKKLGEEPNIKDTGFELNSFVYLYTHIWVEILHVKFLDTISTAVTDERT